MITKNSEQYDSGGIILNYSFLIPFDEKIITEEDVDNFIKSASNDFEFALKMRLMFTLGYEGVVDGKWVKKEKEPQVDLGICVEKNCRDKATKDYNGFKYYVCDYHYKKLNDEFDEDYR